MWEVVYDLLKTFSFFLHLLSIFSHSKEGLLLMILMERNEWKLHYWLQNESNQRTDDQTICWLKASSTDGGHTVGPASLYPLKMFKLQVTENPTQNGLTISAPWKIQGLDWLWTTLNPVAQYHEGPGDSPSLLLLAHNVCSILRLAVRGVARWLPVAPGACPWSRQ